jgi:hypothetical protein
MSESIVTKNRSIFGLASMSVMSLP